MEEECDESIYWMELLVAAKVIKEELLTDLTNEAHQILSIVVASIRTTKRCSNGRKRSVPK